MRKQPPVLPAALQPGRLAGGPLLTLGLGFECRVEVPMQRSSKSAGLAFSLAETAEGPALVVTVADKTGTALAGFITADIFPGALRIITAQCGRMAARMQEQATPPADQETK